MLYGPSSWLCVASGSQSCSGRNCLVSFSSFVGAPDLTSRSLPTLVRVDSYQVLRSTPDDRTRFLALSSHMCVFLPLSLKSFIPLEYSQGLSSSQFLRSSSCSSLRYVVFLGFFRAISSASLTKAGISFGRGDGDTDLELVASSSAVCFLVFLVLLAGILDCRFSISTQVCTHETSEE